MSDITGTNEQVERSETWDARKKVIAASFLAELDDKLTKGKITEATSKTGGVHLEWRKLVSTAGKAKMEMVQVAGGDGSSYEAKHWWAKIKLSDHVLDNEERLLSTLAHEFCHLCTTIISGSRGHGVDWKAWGKLASQTFAGRILKVTRTHNYPVSYKYIIKCQNAACDVEYKRQRRTINLANKSCGRCHGKLLLTKPTETK